MKWQLSSKGRIVERHHENDAAWDHTAACAARAPDRVGGRRGRAAPFRLVESETWPRAAASREPTEARLFWRSSFTVAACAERDGGQEST